MLKQHHSHRMKPAPSLVSRSERKCSGKKTDLSGGTPLFRVYLARELQSHALLFVSQNLTSLT